MDCQNSKATVTNTRPTNEIMRKIGLVGILLIFSLLINHETEYHFLLYTPRLHLFHFDELCLSCLDYH